MLVSMWCLEVSEWIRVGSLCVYLSLWFTDWHMATPVVPHPVVDPSIDAICCKHIKPTPSYTESLLQCIPVHRTFATHQTQYLAGGPHSPPLQPGLRSVVSTLTPPPLPVQVPVSAKGVGEWRGTLADPVSWHSHWFNGISWIMQTLCLFISPGPFFSPNRLGSASVHGVEGSTVEWAGQLGRPGWVVLRTQRKQVNVGAQVWALKYWHISPLSYIPITVIYTWYLISLWWFFFF